jgi:uncharacterized secreted protein with C-terminal beta-propeller domain
MTHKTKTWLRLGAFALAFAFIITAIVFIGQPASTKASGYINIGSASIPLRAITNPAETEGYNAAEAGALPKFAGLTELLARFHGTGVFYSRGTDYSGGWKTEDGIVVDPVPAPSAAAQPATGDVSREMNDGGSGYSDTNAQTSGVAEGDIVKTDGRYIYSLSSGAKAAIAITQASGGDLKVVSRIELGDFSPSELYVSGDSLIAAGTRWEYFGDPGKGASPRPSSDINEFVDCMWYPSRTFTAYKVYDISDRTRPVLQRELELEGYPLATRMVGSTLYFVCQKYIYSLPLEDMAEGDVLPIYRDSATGGYRVVPAEDIYYFPENSDNTYMFAGALDTSSLAPANIETFLGAGSNVYMSLNNLYVVCTRWNAAGTLTDIFRFSVSAGSVTLAAAGTVDGYTQSQYGMDEHNGVFRIATTNWSSTGTTNAVYALDAESLQVIGSVEDLARGETIQSVRFMGDTAYVVTFLQVDPLFIIDMSNPRAPAVQAELKVPGFSTYLHPVGSGLLVGFGRDVLETYVRRNGVEEVVGIMDVGMKVSLFDVSNPFAPKEIHTLSLGQNSYAEAAHNPRAMFVDPARNIFGFAMSGQFNGVWGSVCPVIAVENNRLVLKAQLEGAQYGSRLLYIGDTLYMADIYGIIAFDYNGFYKTGAVNTTAA